ncbi:MAG TPA: prolyl oligopeptidase family serine peptidase [Thermoanaerobaculia bacterium]|nr:prolyl oligopeptidase family serine peptidase [Thermoanaerobaculia bacterium]
MATRRLATAVPLLLLAVLASAAVPFAAAETSAGVTLEKIMSDPDWIGTPPENPYWADDGRAVYFERKRTGSEVRDLYRLELDGEDGTSVRVTDEERGQADVAGGDVSEDRAWKVYSRQGDLYLKDLKTGAIRQLTRTGDPETEPRFLAGDTRISFRRGTSLYVYELPTSLISQPAELHLEKDPAEVKPPATYVEERQIETFDVLRKRKKNREEQLETERAEQQADPTRPPLPWYLGEGLEITQASLSPSGDWMIVVTQPKEIDQGKSSPMVDFVTESGYAEARDVRAKVGTGKPVNPTILLLDLKAHEKHEVDLAALPGIKEDPLKALREKAKKEKDIKDPKDSKDKKKEEEEAAKAAEPALRIVELGRIAWSDDGRRAALLFWSDDNKDRWIATLEPPAAGLVTRHRLSDPAWVNDYDELFEFGWLEDNTTLWYVSEETGYFHLYTLATAGGAGARPRALTQGSFEVTAPVLTRDGKSFYYVANASHPGIYNVWRLDVASGKSEPAAEQISQLGGLTGFSLSPDESRLLLVNSQLARPNELFVQAAEPGAEARQVTHTVSQEFLSYDWSIPEIVAVPSTHAKQPVYSRFFTPPGFDPSRKYPAVIFIHGAGYLQNAHAGWSTYFREYLFHTLLTQHGYVVLDMDYRGSAGYGRDWRTAIYRQMGYPEVEDLEDGVAWLTRTKSVDPQRIGAYGGSYGGFMVMMALFRQPDLFAAGAALRPVTGWAHYNHGYTSNILNTPEVDPEAYAKSSPIEYAEGLKKPLLICHGMQDDNVHFQDTVLLVQRLIELKKENFETAIYPVEPHGFVQPTSWLDEYRRVFKLMETWVKPTGDR